MSMFQELRSLSSEEINEIYKRYLDFYLRERKPVEKKLLPGGFYVGYCPVCNLLLKPVHTSILDSDPGHKPNYCPDCGQHLEWEDK